MLIGCNLFFEHKYPYTRCNKNFVIAMPSSLFDESLITIKAMMIPCSVPASARKKISKKDKSVSPNIGSNMTVTANAPKAGITILDM